MSSAWFCARYSFLGRHFFAKSLILPLAFPSYVLAFIYLGFFSHSGAFFSFLRQNGYDIFFPVNNLFGLSFVMSLSLFPYVYFICSRAFKSYGMRCLETAQSLGFSEGKSFFKLVLPSHKPWIMTGLLIVSLDVISDFGASSLFNYRSLSVVIYHAWYDFFSWEISAQISLSLILISLFMIFSCEKALKKARFTTDTQGFQTPLKKLSGLKGVFVFLFLSVLLFLSFGFPLLQLVFWSWGKSFDIEYVNSFFQSCFLGSIGAFIVIVLSLVFSFTQRWFIRKKNIVLKTLVKISILGYGIPGTVWAVSVLKLSSWASLTSLIALFLGFSLRFLMVGMKPLEAGFERLKWSLDEGAMLLGLRPFKVFFRLQIPLLKSTYRLAFVLVFIEILKEMPMTLMMRPSGWSPLSAKIFELTSEGEWERAAPFSLCIVVLTFLVCWKVKRV